MTVHLSFEKNPTNLNHNCLIGVLLAQNRCLGVGKFFVYTRNSELATSFGSGEVGIPIPELSLAIFYFLFLLPGLSFSSTNYSKVEKIDFFIPSCSFERLNSVA